MSPTKTIISHTFTEKQKCCHHWIIKTMVSSNSKGVCRFCAAEYEFNNYLRDCLKEAKGNYKD